MTRPFCVSARLDARPSRPFYEPIEKLAAMARDQIAATGEATEEDGAEAAERFVRECYETIAPDDLLGRILDAVPMPEVPLHERHRTRVSR